MRTFFLVVFFPSICELFLSVLSVFNIHLLPTFCFSPNIFGPNEDQPLDIEASKKLFQEMTDRINEEVGADKKMSMEDVALGFLKVANEAMARPIRMCVVFMLSLVGGVRV